MVPEDDKKDSSEKNSEKLNQENPAETKINTEPAEKELVSEPGRKMETSGEESPSMEPAEGPRLEPSPELKQALEEAVQSFEKAEAKKRQKEEAPSPPTEQELKLKMEILELRHKIQALEAELEKKAKEVKQNYELGMMLKNQFEAYKARVLREKADWFNYGHEPLIKELLLVLDNFERALAQENKPENFSAFHQGVEMIYRQLLKVLENFGVKQLQAMGQKFDPTYHEAIAQQATPEYPPGLVIEEHHKGYMLKDRLLRAARVTISALPKAQEQEKASALVNSEKNSVPVSEEKEKTAEVNTRSEENPEKPKGENS